MSAGQRPAAGQQDHRRSRPWLSSTRRPSDAAGARHESHPGPRSRTPARVREIDRAVRAPKPGSSERIHHPCETRHAALGSGPARWQPAAKRTNPGLRCNVETASPSATRASSNARGSRWSRSSVVRCPRCTPAKAPPPVSVQPPTVATTRSTRSCKLLSVDCTSHLLEPPRPEVLALPEISHHAWPVALDSVPVHQLEHVVGLRVSQRTRQPVRGVVGVGAGRSSSTSSRSHAGDHRGRCAARGAHAHRAPGHPPRQPVRASARAEGGGP